MNKNIKNALLLGAVVAFAGSVHAAGPDQYSLDDRNDRDRNAFELRRTASINNIQAHVDGLVAGHDQATIDNEIEQIHNARKDNIARKRADGIAAVAPVAALDETGLPALVPQAYALKNTGDANNVDDYEQVGDPYAAFKAGTPLFSKSVNAVTADEEVNPLDLSNLNAELKKRQDRVTADQARHDNEVAQYGKDEEAYYKPFHFEANTINNPHNWTLSKARAADAKVDGVAKYYEEHRLDKSVPVETQLTKDKVKSLTDLANELKFGGSLDEEFVSEYTKDPKAAKRKVDGLLQRNGQRIVASGAFDALVGLTKAPTDAAIDAVLALCGAQRGAWESALQAKVGGGAPAAQPNAFQDPRVQQEIARLQAELEAASNTSPNVGGQHSGSATSSGTTSPIQPALNNAGGNTPPSASLDLKQLNVAVPPQPAALTAQDNGDPALVRQGSADQTQSNPAPAALDKTSASSLLANGYRKVGDDYVNVAGDTVYGFSVTNA